MGNKDKGISFEIVVKVHPKPGIHITEKGGKVIVTKEVSQAEMDNLVAEAATLQSRKEE